MKSPHKSIIRISLIFTAIFWVSCFFTHFSVQAQGFNNNEWIFGYCGPNTTNNYLSFGKGGDPVVRTLNGTVIVGEQNNAVAIDPITGQVIFYSNGVLIYNYDNIPIQGAPNGINGDVSGRQTVAIGALDYDVDGDKLFYIFYLSPAGQLQYAVVDMNEAGGATGNQPPLGAVTAFNQQLGNASGAIAVVKASGSPSYLISFEGGNLVSRRIENAQGSFTQTGTTALGFTPKAIVFSEATQQLILIPENPNEDLVIVDYDPNTGNFGASVTIAGSGGADPIEGAVLSPDGDFLYFSRGDTLFRVPTDDLNATPEAVPIEGDIYRVYDLKVGPDGNLYYIYEEVLGGPQLIGRINNPDEEVLEDLDIEEDPFNGTDFCGRVFPQFAPNQDINPNVDFTWEPDEPCANNPLQLTSVITPENYRPVSFEWTFDPPLVDEDGNPIEADYNQEHLLLPAEATAQESVNVTLTVTFADGTVRRVPKTIVLTPNELQAQFTAQDTTVCEGACVDIGSLLEVQSGGGQGGGGGAPGGGGGGNYEYFWSNDRQWTTNRDNCVLLPGLYWVLVREVGSTCYAYASIRVRIWDLPDQSNSVWYFGNGSGLDFNIDPNNPNAPVPRAVSQPRNIPAGTTTISDETGQVLFYTDGETVWDLNGNVMQNGENIGGSNQSSQSVIAVPVPTDETIFYLFTTQATASGGTEVKFSVVDIKVENPTGVGNVVTKDNFLFSPSTEHSAALASGDTTWVLFHELGNNTFRAYPVSSLGIGSPVLSSVGSNHGFNSGVGSMKFSPDGSKVAVTIQDGACSRLEIFDFNQRTGRLTEYALLDLGCNNEQIYGLEFSNDSNRVFVSYTGAGGNIEEFIIQDPTGAGADNTLPCGVCFGNASNSTQRAQCILATRNTLSTSGPFGALQMGPDGQIYVARPGQNMLGSINPGQDCNNSNYNAMGSPPLTGTSTLGLPSNVQMSGSSIPEPALSGPEELCLDPNAGVVGLFEGGGEPDIDSYFWTIVHEDGTQILNNFGGPGEEFQNLEQNFTREGRYIVTLNVDRCGDPNYFNESIEVLVVAPPILTLPTDITLCVGTPVSLTAIDGYDPAQGLYDFEWRNAAGQLFGDRNSNTISVNEESIFTVTVTFRDQVDPCPATASVFVGPAFDFELTQTAQEVCYDGPLVVFAPDTPVSGQWFYQVQGTTNRIPLGSLFELELLPASLPSPGLYDIIFITEDPIVPGCAVEKSVELLVWPLPVLEVLVLTDADDCETPNGSLEITMISDADQVRILETGQTFVNVSAGQVLPVITGLEPGVYTIEALNDAGCVFSQTATIRNLTPPAGLDDFTITVVEGACTPTGIGNGQLVVTFNNGPQSGTYRAIRQGDGQIFSGNFTGATFSIGVPAGTYTVELIDQNDCAVPAPFEYLVTDPLQVEFSVPTEVVACAEYILVPQSDQNLQYTVRNALGTSILPNADGTFTFDVTGTYTIIGTDPTGLACPLERRMNIAINRSPDYSVSTPIVDCQVGISYRANLTTGNPANFLFFWRNSAGDIVGRSQEFVPRVAGEYTLEVQPNSGAFCPSNPIPFTAEVLPPPVDMVLESLPFCGDDAFTTISIQADLSNVQTINWFRLQGNQRTPIVEFENEATVTVVEGGVFEVVLLSELGCELARESIEVIKYEILPPVLQASYTICALENIVSILDPGEYDFYTWERNGEVVSSSRQFTPTLPGNYTLTVGETTGCEFTVSFQVVEDCDLKIRFPNAIRPSDPTRHFKVFVNDFVDEVEILIYNRWGELIHYCKNINVNSDADFCTWDGTVRGTVVPIGSYPVVVRYTSNNQNVTRTLTRSIVVIE